MIILKTYKRIICLILVIFQNLFASAQIPSGQFWAQNMPCDSTNEIWIWDNNPANTGIVDNGNGTWDATTQNWIGSKKCYLYPSNSVWPTGGCREVVFGGKYGIGNAGTVTLAAPVTNIKSISFRLTLGGNFTITGQNISPCGNQIDVSVDLGGTGVIETIIKSSKIVKVGKGLLYLRGNNTFPAGAVAVEVNEGILSLSPPGNGAVYSNLGGTIWNINNGSTLRFDNNIRTDVQNVTVNFGNSGGGTLALNGTSNYGGVNLYGGGNFTINTNNTGTNSFTTNGVGLNVGAGGNVIMNVVGSDVLNVSCVFWNSGIITKKGTGVVNLNGNSPALNGVTINGGTVVAGHLKAFGNGTITVNAGATLNLNGFAITNTIVNNGGIVIP